MIGHYPHFFAMTTWLARLPQIIQPSYISISSALEEDVHTILFTRLLDKVGEGGNMDDIEICTRRMMMGLDML